MMGEELYLRIKIGIKQKENTTIKETEEGNNTVLMNAAVLLPGRTSGIEAPCRFNCSLTSSGSNCRNV